jgi:predicted nucleotidyltransferase component of viral defense system
MIDRAEIEDMAGHLDVHTSHVQRDYVHGWILAELFRGSELASRLALKGGNGLRKAYFTSGRYSRDLDFSAADGLDPELLRASLHAICQRIEDQAGVEFVHDRIHTGEKRGADEGKRISEARVYFKDFYGQESEIVLGVRMDVTEFDRLYLPVQSRNLIHPYSDRDACSTPIRCAKLEEILASKMRCLLQRKHIADLYDLAFPLLLGRDLDLDRRELLQTFFRITIFGASPGVAKGLLIDLPFEGLRRFWGNYIAAPIASRFSFDAARDTVRGLVDALLPEAPIRSRSPVLFPAELRNPIMEAGSALKLLRF